MAETKNKKGFRAGVYAVIVIVVLAVVLTSLTLFAYTTRYTAFAPDKVAVQYVDTIVQTGDGYNAYKNTLVSENKKMKYGDFIRRAYMRPYVNEKDASGKEVPQAAFVGTGSKQEQEAIDKVYNTMYDYYAELVKTNGWDNYDAIFDNYFKKLVEVRKAVYGDDFMDYEFMFGAFEANVATYGENLAGVEEQLAADNKTVLREAKDGQYQTLFGKDYKLTATVKSCDQMNEADTKTYVQAFRERIAPVVQAGKEKAEKSGLQDTDKDTPKSDMIGAYERLDCADEITGAAKAVVEVRDQNDATVATQEVYLVKVGKSWYVDNTNVDTAGLYLAK